MKTQTTITTFVSYVLQEYLFDSNSLGSKNLISTIPVNNKMSKVKNSEPKTQEWRKISSYL